MSNFKLCYVDGRSDYGNTYCAYFTTQSLKTQTGDDWNDSPYELNAGPPYEYGDHDKKEGRAPWKITKVYFTGLIPACEAASNRELCVDDINQDRKAPWVETPYWNEGAKIAVFAGDTLQEFKKAVWAAGGQIFEEVKPDGHIEEQTAYLAGPMEYASDYGMGWRERMREMLAPLNIRCILPNEEEGKFVTNQAQLNEIKKHEPEKYKLIMRQFIKQDLEFVETVTMIITEWSGERMSGTIGEAQHAFLHNQPAYLITDKEFHEIPGWFLSCYTKIFINKDLHKAEKECVQYIKKMYGHSKGDQ